MDIVVGLLFSSPVHGDTAFALRMSYWTLATADEYTGIHCERHGEFNNAYHMDWIE